jgi:hypothetical protein
MTLARAIDWMGRGSCLVQTHRLKKDGNKETIWALMPGPEITPAIADGISQNAQRTRQQRRLIPRFIPNLEEGLLSGEKSLGCRGFFADERGAQ